MGVELAISPSIRTPGVALSVNLLGGASSPGGAPLKALVIAPRGPNGTITPDSQVVEGLAGPDDAAGYLQEGTPGHLTCKAIFTEYKTAEVDLISPAAASGATATFTLAFDDSTGASTDVTVAQTVTLVIAGRTVVFNWLPGVGKVAAATGMVAAILAQSGDLPVSAGNSSGSSATVTVSADFPGTWGSDVQCILSFGGGAGGSATNTTGTPPAVVTGTTDVTSGGLYSSGGTLNGLTLILDDGTGPQTLNLSGSGNTANEAAFLAAIVAKWPKFTAVAGGGGGTKLVLTNPTIGSAAALNVGSGTANTALGLTPSSTNFGTGPFGHLTGGSGEMTIANALTTLGGLKEYDFIALVTSNADFVVDSPSSNLARLKAYITQYQTGMAARLQQALIGYTGALSSAKGASAYYDFAQFELPIARNGQSLPCEWMGAELGARMRERGIFSIKNRIRMAYIYTLYPSANLVADAFSAVEQEDALQHGLTPVVYDNTQAPMPLRPITSYWEDIYSNPDDRILDVVRVDGLYDVAKDLRQALPETFPGMSLSPDLGAADDELPPNVVEIGTIRAYVVQRLRVWQDKGVLRKDLLDAAVGTPQDPGTLICQIDETNSSMVDLVIPAGIIPPLADFSLVIQQAQ